MESVPHFSFAYNLLFSIHFKHMSPHIQWQEIGIHATVPYINKAFPTWKFHSCFREDSWVSIFYYVTNLDSSPHLHQSRHKLKECPKVLTSSLVSRKTPVFCQCDAHRDLANTIQEDKVTKRIIVIWDKASYIFIQSQAKLHFSIQIVGLLILWSRFYQFVINNIGPESIITF